MFWLYMALNHGMLKDWPNFQLLYPANQSSATINTFPKKKAVIVVAPLGDLLPSPTSTIPYQYHFDTCAKPAIE